MALVHLVLHGTFAVIALLVTTVAAWQRLDAVPAAVPSVASAAGAPSGAAGSSAAIVDVAAGVRDVASLIRIAPDERVTAVAGRAVCSDLEAGEALAAMPRGPGRYVDLDVASAVGTRRIVVLLH